MKDEKGTWKLLFIYLFLKRNKIILGLSNFFFASTFVCSLIFWFLFVCFIFKVDRIILLLNNVRTCTFFFVLNWLGHHSFA